MARRHLSIGRSSWFIYEPVLIQTATQVRVAEAFQEKQQQVTALLRTARAERFIGNGKC